MGDIPCGACNVPDHQSYNVPNCECWSSPRKKLDLSGTFSNPFPTYMGNIASEQIPTGGTL